jgi:hypothetical protein
MTGYIQELRPPGRQRDSCHYGFRRRYMKGSKGNILPARRAEEGLIWHLSYLRLDVYPHHIFSPSHKFRGSGLGGRTGDFRFLNQRRRRIESDYLYRDIHFQKQN